MKTSLKVIADLDIYLIDKTYLIWSWKVFKKEYRMIDHFKDILFTRLENRKAIFLG